VTVPAIDINSHDKELDAHFTSSLRHSFFEKG
jgi:hypothetical protein